MSRVLFLILFAFLCNNLWAQEQNLDLKETRLLADYQRASIPLDQLKICNDILYFYKDERKDFYKAKQYGLHAETLINKGLESPLVSSAYRGIGWIYLNDGEMSSAYSYFSKSLEYADKIEDEVEYGKSLQALGELYTQIRNYYLAEKLLYQGLVKSFIKNDTAELGNAYVKLALLNHKQRKYAKAGYFFERSINYFEKTHLKAMVILETNNVGYMFAEQKMYKKAREWYEKAYHLAEKFNMKGEAGYVHGNIGQMFKLEKRYDTAYAMFERDKVYSINSKDYRSAFYAFHGLAEMDYKLGRFDKALTLVDSAIKVVKDLKVKPTLFDLLETKALILSKLNRNKEAIELLVYVNDGIDSMRKLNLNTAANLALQNYLVQDAYALDQTKKSAEAIKKKVIIYGIITSVIFIAGLFKILYIIKTNRKNKKLNQELSALKIEMDELETRVLVAESKVKKDLLN